MSKIYGNPVVTPLFPGNAGGGGGANGKSAYELAVSEGYEGTLAEWLESLNGDPGPRGPIPIKGVDYFTDAEVEEIAASAAEKVTPDGIGARPNTWTPTAQDVGARPDNWMPTAQEVGARPNTWMPSASDVGARPDNWMPTAQEVGARPNTWMPTASDVGAEPATADSTYPGCYYRMVNGAKEWINPPMVHNKDYRTIKRYTGTTPIYTKYINAGKMPVGTASGPNTIQVNTGVDHSKVVDWCIHIDSNDEYCNLPFISSGEIGGDAWLSGSQVHLRSYRDLSTYSVHIVIDYIK